MELKAYSPAHTHIEHCLRIQISRRHIASATPTKVRFVPLLFRRQNRCPSSCKWEFRVTDYHHSMEY